MRKDERGRLSAAEAAQRLGVKPETLYAYVSRGLLERRRRPGDRASWFDPGEVDRLARRGRGAGAEARREVRIESSVTAIEGGTYYYRGLEATALARAASFERVAELLWTGELPDDACWHADPAAVEMGRAVQRVLPDHALPFDRIRLVTAALAGADPFRYDVRRETVVGATRQLIATLEETLPARRAGRGRPERRFAARLWRRVSAAAPHAAQLDALDQALSLLADHELAASTFAVRIAAAFRADPYGAIGAGFGVLGGAWHGAASLATEAILRRIRARGEVAPVIDEALRAGEGLPGFGQSLYPDGDPRATHLLALVREAAPRGSKRLREIEAYVAATRDRGIPPPNVDLALAALGHVFDLCRGASELIFALARIAGWVAHALEEYEHPSALRPRAVYTGPKPAQR